MLFALCALKLPLLKFWEPVSIHNIYNVPLGAGASSGGPEGRSCELQCITNYLGDAALQSWISVTFPLLPFPPSWSSHCQSTPLMTLAPGKIPRTGIFFDFLLGSSRTLSLKKGNIF